MLGGKNYELGIDKGGMLKVGPLSAGSDTGQACYERGEEPALTDAFLLSGYLNSASFADGNVGLDQDRSVAAFQKIADHLESDVLDILIHWRDYSSRVKD